MKKSQMKAIGETLPSLVRPDMTAKDLMNAARAAFPKASKKVIAQAAFYSLIVDAELDSGRASQIHDFGIKARAL